MRLWVVYRRLHRGREPKGIAMKAFSMIAERIEATAVFSVSDPHKVERVLLPVGSIRYSQAHQTMWAAESCDTRARARKAEAEHAGFFIHSHNPIVVDVFLKVQMRIVDTTAVMVRDKQPASVKRARVKLHAANIFLGAEALHGLIRGGRFGFGLMRGGRFGHESGFVLFRRVPGGFQSHDGAAVVVARSSGLTDVKSPCTPVTLKKGSFPSLALNHCPKQGTNGMSV